jgi:hypothetical protein
MPSAHMSGVGVAPTVSLAEVAPKPLWVFRATVSFGFVVNMLFALPALFAPRFLERLLNLHPSSTPEWLQNVGILLIIISVMYIPAMLAPFRYLFISYLLIAGRFAAGVLFLSGLLFMNYPSGFWTLALNDLILAPVQAVSFYYLLKLGGPPPEGAHRTEVASHG